MSVSKPVGGRFYELQQEVKIPEPYVVADGIVINPPTKKQLEAFSVAATDTEREAALLGKDHKKIAALFDDKPFQLWKKLQEDILIHFFGNGADETPGK